jgi:hypothetical protein
MSENPYQAPKQVGELPRRTSLAQFTAYGIHSLTVAAIAIGTGWVLLKGSQSILQSILWLTP